MATRKWDQNGPDRDVLRARFTIWLDTTLSRASKRYSKQMEDKLEKESEVFSMSQVSPDCFADPNDCYAAIESDPTNFDFEEERLAKAFAKLPLMRQEVLRLLFVEDLEPEEISDILHCSRSYVNLQKFRALEKLRQLLEKG